MKILVLGGTGAIGKHIVELLRPNNSVYVTSRSKNKEADGVTYILGNALDFDFLQIIFSKNSFDVIIDFMSYSTEEFLQRVDLFLNATDQYLFLSSSRVYAESNIAITENTKILLDSCENEEYLKTDEYALRKARQENILRNSGYSNWTIIRPYITYSDIRFQLGVNEKEQWLFRALRGKPVVLSKDIASKYTTLTFGGDVALVMTKLIGNKKAFGEIFQITSAQSITWDDILKIYLRVIEDKTGKKVKICVTPNAIVPNESEYQYQYDRLYNRIFDCSKVQSVIDSRVEFISIEKGLVQCLEKFIDNNLLFHNISWRSEAMLDRVAKCKTKLSEIPKPKDRITYFVYRYTHGLARFLSFLNEFKILSNK